MYTKNNEILRGKIMKYATTTKCTNKRVGYFPGNWAMWLQSLLGNNSD